MKSARMVCLLWGGLLRAGSQPHDINVNCRYTVESIEISGHNESSMSAGLRKEIKRLVGEKFNPSAFDELARRIRNELHVRSVTHHLMRGTQPEHVRVVYEPKGHTTGFDLSVPKFFYHGRQGWSAAIEGTTTVGPNSFSAGLISDNDELPERYAGVTARYENKHVGTDRVRLRFSFASYHDQWNHVVPEALDASPGVPGIYRTRQNFEPAATIVIARPLTVSVGAGFQRFQTQFPAAHFQAANAAIALVRFHQQIEAAGGDRHDLDASYSLRAATRMLDSDFVYARHRGAVAYAFIRGHHTIADEASAGVISGRAPLFERFVLGNSSTLRGWNRFDLDPLGGDRMAHNSLEYRYHWFDIFYDTGAIWSRNQDPIARHSLGLGVRQGGFFLAVAFPVKEGRAEPIFMMGMNY